MNTMLWVAQCITALIFLYSGINKSVFSERKLVAKGQTGVEGLPLTLIRFIGISEIFGATGLIVPWWTDILPVLTPIAAICLAVMMILAARIHYKRKEYKNVRTNSIIFLICLFIAYGRLVLL